MRAEVREFLAAREPDRCSAHLVQRPGRPSRSSS